MLKNPIEILKGTWWESLESLKPRTVGRFLLVSLQSLLRIYTTLPFAWFLPTTLFAGLIFDSPILVYAFYITLFVRLVHPSIHMKTMSYWQDINIVDWILFFGVLLLQAIPNLQQVIEAPYVLPVYNFFLKVFLLAGNNWLPGTEDLGVFVVFLSPLVILWVLFMLDARKTPVEYFKAFFRAVAMMFYNYPFFLVTYEIFRLMIAGGYLIMEPLMDSYQYTYTIGWALLLAFFVPYYICFLTSYYIKWVHSQFGFYYKS